MKWGYQVDFQDISSSLKHMNGSHKWNYESEIINYEKLVKGFWGQTCLRLTWEKENFISNSSNINMRSTLTSLPSLRTKTRSLSITVGIRWAMVQTVQSLNSVRMIFWIRLSVAVSTEAVASSSTSMRACFSNARPNATSWRCPTLQLSPFSKTARQREISSILCLQEERRNKRFGNPKNITLDEQAKKRIYVHKRNKPGVSSFCTVSRTTSPSWHLLSAWEKDDEKLQ